MASRSLRIGILGSVVALVALQASCSLILDKEIAQCDVSTDCAAKGPEFAGYACSPDKVCTKPAEYCDTNEQCIQANGGQPFLCAQDTHRCAPGCAAAADGTKSADQQCIDAHGGKPFRCISGQCAVGCLSDDQCVAALGAGNVCTKDTMQCAPGCRTDDQCVSLVGKGNICSTTSQTCVPGCRTDDQCVALVGKGNICPTTTQVCTPGCRTNADCIDQNGGTPFQCKKDTFTCSPILLAPHCPQVVTTKNEDLRSDDILYVGLVSSHSGSTFATGVSILEATQLANLEVYQTIGGGLPMGKKRRPVAIVDCDSNVDVTAATKHLVNTVGVHSMLGPSQSGAFTAVAASILQPANVFAIAHAGGAITLGPILKNSNGLFWRTVPSDILQVQAVSPYIGVLEAAVRTKLGLQSTDQIRVAVVSTTDALGAGYSSYLGANLMFNGKTAAANDTNFKSLSIGDPIVDAGDSATKQLAAAQALIAFQPHIVFYGTRIEGLSGVTKPVEAGLTSAAAFLPYHVYSGSLFNSAVATFLNTNYADQTVRENLRLRMSGVTPTSTNPSQLADYKNRHHAQWDNHVWSALPVVAATGMPPVSSGPSLFSSSSYDAAYVLFSALIATGKEDPTGPEIGMAIAKTQGTAMMATDIGPLTAATLTDALSKGNTVNLNGVLSALDFDTENTIKTNVAAWCVTKANAAGVTGNPIESGFNWDTTALAFTGTAPVNGVFTTKCP